MEWTGRSSPDAGWNGEIADRVAKERAAAELAERLRPGDVVGVGSGSTSYLTLCALADRAAADSLSFRAIVTSIEMERACAARSVPVTVLSAERPDWSFDGADEVDPEGNMIKGRGGALLREKLLIKSSPEVYIVIDSSKQVAVLGGRVPVPLEVVPDALALVEHELGDVAGVASVTLRPAGGKDGPVITEHGNVLVDVVFSSISPGLETELKSLTGVVESGLFLGYRPHVVVADAPPP